MIAINPAENLVGQTVNGVWLVEERVKLDELGSTGGFFCLPYKVRNTETDQRAFLKVLDVVKAIQRYDASGQSVVDTLKHLTSAHVFERDLMEACNVRRLKRIVKALDHGEIRLELPPLGHIGFPFLIFELADGDTHSNMRHVSGRVDVAWWLRIMHQAAVGIQQLHKIEVVHQDLKGSNLLFFGPHESKIADLGRAVRKGFPSLNDDRSGDRTYMPPELWYGFRPGNWDERFLALDLYLLGGLAFSGIMAQPITSAVFQRMPREFLPWNYSGKFEDALPVLTKGLADVLHETQGAFPASIREMLTATLRQLCHPNPAKRGHPENFSAKHSLKFSVERYVSLFDRMALWAAQRDAQ